MESFISKQSDLFTGEEKTYLKAGEYIGINDYLFSPNGCWKLTINGFHLFSFRHSDKYAVVSWDARLSQDYKQCFGIMQHDGNFCVYEGTGPKDQGKCLWATNTVGKGKIAVMQWDGNFCIYNQTSPTYKSGCIVWQSGYNTGLAKSYEVKDVEYFYDKITKLPSSNITAFSQTITNDTNIEQQTSIKFSVKYAEKHSWQSKQSWSVSAKASISGKIPFGPSIGFEISGGFSKESVEGKEISTETVKEYTVPVKVSPNSKVRVVAIVKNEAIRLPFLYKGEFTLINGEKSECEIAGVFEAQNSSDLDVKYVTLKLAGNAVANSELGKLDGIRLLKCTEGSAELVSVDKSLIKEV